MIHTYLYRKGEALKTEVSRTEMFSALTQKEALLWVDLVEPTEF